MSFSRSRSDNGSRSCLPGLNVYEPHCRTNRHSLRKRHVPRPMRSFYSTVFSWTFLGGLLTGLALGSVGLVLFAQYMMTQADPSASEDVQLTAPDLPDRSMLATYGTVPDEWVLQPAVGEDSTRFARLKGDPVLVNVWATWCAPCKVEMPTLQALHDSIGSDLRVAVVSSESRGQVRRYVENAGHSLPVYVVDHLPLPFDGQVVPRTFIVRPDGHVVYRHTGAADWNSDRVHDFLDRFRHPLTSSVEQAMSATR